LTQLPETLAAFDGDFTALTDSDISTRYHSDWTLFLTETEFCCDWRAL